VNLGAQLIAAGKGFSGYADGLPSEGSLVASSGNYARYHVPYTNWQAADAPTSNHIPSSANKPFTAFQRRMPDSPLCPASR